MPIEFTLMQMELRKGAKDTVFLINKLKDYDLDEIAFYIPQILNIAYQSEFCVEFAFIFADLVRENFILGLKIYWMMRARLKNPQNSKSVEHMLCEVTKAIEKRPLPLFYKEIQCDALDFNSYCSEYFINQRKIFKRLVKISIELINKGDEKDNYLKAFIKNIDSWIKNTCYRYSFNKSEYVKKLYRGLILPTSDNDIIRQIIRIPDEEVFYYQTKARVPFKVVFETIFLSENDPDQIESPIITTLPDESSFSSFSSISETLPDRDTLRFENLENFTIQDFTDEYEIIPYQNPNVKSDYDPWGERWEETKSRIKSLSPFNLYQTWDAKAFIIKGNDDLRQELLAMQIIKKCKEIFKNEKLPLFLHPYDIIIVSHNTGIIECIPDAVSLHTLKKHTRCLTTFFISKWGKCLQKAQQNFVRSMAGYSLICYLLNLKDRHNGNILMDTKGHIIHIDFGFFLTNSPGKINLESTAFKLTNEMIEIMGGRNSEMFFEFKTLFYRGLMKLRDNSRELSLLLTMMYPGENLPCFYNKDKAVIEFRERLLLGKNELECTERVEYLIDNAADNWRTNKYDQFQYTSNKILY
ncbi:hypothetical protein SteCoe_18412 [Stentor coeruleus]|uniref:1-phosphatidylinositol 4-kinase n=1 Tax=Stentor coeruleus TaxID=5963 RepID=A0A1R2BWS7_9CILI|nr:hypothetical protein SteCoe_18412 [Stentor coeruleus]